MSRRKRLRFESLEARQLLAADFKITEFMASNSRAVADEDGDHSDWIEIANTGSSAGSLDGWHLTDDDSKLDKWQLPNVSLAANERIVVWASNKNRDAVSGPLHTNFKLSSSGEYLALVKPDSTTVVSQFFPEYPQQFTDISYGLSEAGPQAGQFRFFAEPSPGKSNAAASANVSPFLTDLKTNSNGSPADDKDIVVTVEAISQGAPISRVDLHYVVMFGAEKTQQMFDDGTHGDAQARDGVFTVTIPQAESKAGEMVRFYATASASGDSMRLPRFSSLNNQKFEGVVIADPSVNSQLPVFQWFVPDPNWFRNPGGGNNKNPTPASLFYNGEFYDNLSVEVKGNLSSQYLLPKFKFTLPKDKKFQFAPDKLAVKKFDLQSGYQDPSFVRNVMGFELFRNAGSLAPDSFHVQTRMNGEFYELGIYIERIDEYFLQNHGLSENDAIYKSDGLRDSQGYLLPAADLGSTAGFEKKNRDDIDPSFADLQALINGVSPSNPNRLQYMMDNVNLPEVISTLAVYALVKHYDSTSQNYYLHRDSDGTGRWNLIPWDMDLIWDRLNEPVYGRYFSGHPFTGSSSIPTWTSAHWNRLYDAIFDVPETQEMFLRRLRSLMDEYLQPPTTPAGQRLLEGRAAELAAMIRPEALADYAKWQNITSTSWGNIGSLSNGIAHLNSKFDVRRNYLYGLNLIPAAQPASFPVQFGDVDSFPDSGNQKEEYIVLKNPNTFAIDISQWKLTGGVSHEFAKGTVIPAKGSLYVVRDENAFRKRATGPRGGQGLLMQGNYEGELSSEGETLNLVNASGALIKSFNVPKVNLPPTIATIADQTIDQASATPPINVVVNDADTPVGQLVYSATSQSPLYLLNQQLKLSVPVASTGGATYYTNYRGSNERYLINTQGTHPNNQWYYILPSGDLYLFTGSVASSASSSLRGTLIATVGTAVYQNPTLLTAAVSTGGNTTFQFTGTSPKKLVVTPNPAFVGDINVTVSVSDGKTTRSTPFTLRVEKRATKPPAIAAIGPQTATSGTVLTVPLSVSDADTPLTNLQFSGSGESPLARLDAQLNLSAPASASYYLNYRGGQEKYLTNPSGNAANLWYYILPKGDLFRFTGNVSSSSPASLTGVFVATVGTDVYANPALLHSPSGNTSPLTTTFTGTPVNAMNITIPANFVGVTPVTVTVSDGINQASRTFDVSVTATPPGVSPRLHPIADQAVASGATKILPLTVIDPDTAASLLNYTASIRATSSSSGPGIALSAPVTGGFAAYYQNYRGSQEKYLTNLNGSAANRWYYILQNGDFYRFTGNVGSSSPSSLTGAKIGNFGTAAYSDPTRLINGTVVNPGTVTVTGGAAPSLKIIAADDFVGTAEVTVTVSDGTTSDQKKLTVSIQKEVGPVNAAPQLGNLTDRVIAPGSSLGIDLNATDDGIPGGNLTFTASVASRAGQLNQSLNLTKPASGSFAAYYQNFRGSNEKYLLNPNGVEPNRWYYLVPNGDLYRFTGNAGSSSPTSLSGVRLTNLGVQTYQNPALLHDATTNLTSLSVSFDGPPTTRAMLIANASFNVPAIVSITVSDGSKTDTQSFEARPATPAAGEPLAFPSSQVPWKAQSSAVSLSIFGDPQLAESIPTESLSRNNMLDVNGQGGVTALDALQIINFLNSTTEMERGQAMIDAILTNGLVLDTSGDGFVTAIDALLVINKMNEQSPIPSELLIAHATGMDQFHVALLSDPFDVDERVEEMRMEDTLF